MERMNDSTVRRAIKLFVEPPRRVLRPLFRGLEHVPDARPLLFVGNHTLYGVLDIAFFWAELYEKKGLFLRGLGDHLHFRVPVWRDLLTSLGAVDGTRENCARLLREGEAVLVFPGGGREVVKRKGERYQLLWKDRLGFVRMAAEHGATIVPFASVGVEHALDVVLDADDVMRSPLGPLLRRAGVREDVVMPIAKGIGPTPMPRPERLYFQLQPPISTAPFAGRHDDVAAMRALRDQVRSEVRAALDELMVVRDADPERPLAARLAAAARDSRRRRT